MTLDHSQVGHFRLKQEYLFILHWNGCFTQVASGGGRHAKESERGQVAPRDKRAERLLLIGQCSVNGNSLRGLKKEKKKKNLRGLPLPFWLPLLTRVPSLHTTPQRPPSSNPRSPVLALASAPSSLCPHAHPRHSASSRWPARCAGKGRPAAMKTQNIWMQTERRRGELVRKKDRKKENSQPQRKIKWRINPGRIILQSLRPRQSCLLTSSGRARHFF